ncbi:nitroreductase family protein [Ancylostoma ceylanicum]|uniref:Nitroreductase family protein n=1 Tax=Ancylostoma ceylanicum TaxID=53326 RepID=A0A0D6M3C5_9BILA|nr:nitroreductase family protein [Ancylostoma ceylanicum]
MVQDFMNKVPLFLDSRSSEALLNVVVSILVIAFISHQVLSLFFVSSKKDDREILITKDVKPRRDRACGDDSSIADLHEHIFKEKEVLYHIPHMHEREMLRASQYFYEQMKMRRSCSPSAGNAQPWKFCIVVDDNRKAEIRSLIEADEKDNHVQRKGEGSEWVMGISQLQQTWRRPYLTDAPLLLVVCHEIFTSVEDKTVRLFHYNQISTAIAVGMLVSAIQYVGLSTVVTSPLNAGSRISRLLRRPDNECVMLLLPLGYASADALVPDFKRKPIESFTNIY